MKLEQEPTSDEEEVGTTDRTHLSWTWKVVILLCLSCQTTSFVILRRYSTAIRKEKFDKSSVLLVSETVKLVISVVGISFGLGKSHSEEMQSITAFERGFAPEPQSALARFRVLVTTSGPMVVQAIIYLAQNLLAFMALECLEGGTYSLLMQGKLLATAMFSIVLMSQNISARQWRSLVMLVLAVVQISTETRPKPKPGTSGADEATHLFVKGLFYTFANVMLSGFSTVYMERTFKDVGKNLTLWERNFQLAFCSIIVYIAILMYSAEGSIFANWSWLAVAIALIASVGGLLVALSLKYTDSILKSMSSTIAIVMTTCIDWWFLDGPMTLPIAIGGAFVILSVYSYNDTA